MGPMTRSVISACVDSRLGSRSWVFGQLVTLTCGFAARTYELCALPGFWLPLAQGVRLAPDGVTRIAPARPRPQCCFRYRAGVAEITLHAAASGSVTSGTVAAVGRHPGRRSASLAARRGGERRTGPCQLACGHPVDDKRRIPPQIPRRPRERRRDDQRGVSVDTIERLFALIGKTADNPDVRAPRPGAGTGSPPLVCCPAVRRPGLSAACARLLA